MDGANKEEFAEVVSILTISNFIASDSTSTKINNKNIYLVIAWRQRSINQQNNLMPYAAYEYNFVNMSIQCLSPSHYDPIQYNWLPIWQM
jgi:hypothetical protein